jgi:hypothetical protein
MTLFFGHKVGCFWVILKTRKPANSVFAGFLVLGEPNFIDFSGERGIRTPGSLTFNGFQDRRNRPLCHLSGAKIVSMCTQSKYLFMTMSNKVFWITEEKIKMEQLQDGKMWITRVFISTQSKQVHGHSISPNLAHCDRHRHPPVVYQQQD